MTTTSEHARREMGMALKFGAVGFLGFLTDATLLHLGIHLGLTPAMARVISLTSAMQVTFAVNGLFVFRCLKRQKLPHQWLGYMTANGLGNLCNYFIFLAFVSSRLPVVSDHLFALASGSFTAWFINYVGTRFVVFGRAIGPAIGKVGLERAEEAICGPATDETPDASPERLTPWRGQRSA
jgi:putative flippase GtrA